MAEYQLTANDSAFTIVVPEEDREIIVVAEEFTIIVPEECFTIDVPGRVPKPSTMYVDNGY